MTFPVDSVQNIVTAWWEQREGPEVRRGSLIFAFVPHVDQVPLTLKPIARKEAEQHTEAKVEISPLRIRDPRPKEPLPVAALSLPEGELWSAYRAKRRPCLVIGMKQPVVADSLRRDMPKKSTSPTIMVAPYYGVDKDGRRAGYNQKLVQRIKHAEYPQFILDFLPIPGPKQSLLRLDHIQPIGNHYNSYEYTGYCLSDESVEMILNDWLQWFLFGGLPPSSLILDFQKQIIDSFGQ